MLNIQGRGEGNIVILWKAQEMKCAEFKRRGADVKKE
jgi:hypothetical protein